MTRLNVFPDPSVKEFEAYLDFSGGRNTEISNEKLQTNEFPEFLNVDMRSRSSAKKRWGRTKIATVAGTSQGAFLYFRSGVDGPDTILAVSGQLYVQPYGLNTFTNVPITDGGVAFTFQTTLPISAVQYGTHLFLATGTKLVELYYDLGTATWKANTAVPYTPTVMEAIYIGLNGLAANPSAYIQDGTAAALAVVGIQPANPSGAVNTKTTMTAYVNKPASITSVDYKWEYKKSSDSTFVLGQDWATDAAGKLWDFIPDTATNYDIKVTARDHAVTTTTATYTLTGFVVNQVADKANNYLPYSAIQKCRGILLHWDRLLLYLDDTNPFQMYISDLENAYYFPVTNTLSFDTGKQEPIEVVTRFQNMLVVQTPTTIQTVVGKAPSGADAYQRYQINDTIGCTQGRTAVVVGNSMYFKSADGILSLRPNPYRLETMNVTRIDAQIRSEIAALDDAGACAMMFDNQYWICFPNAKVIYRYYFEHNVWSKDTSSKLDFVQFVPYEASVYNLSSGGNWYKQDPTVYADDGEAYNMEIDTKYLDLEASFNYKKLKRIYVLASGATTSQYYVTIYADNAIVLNPDTGAASIDAGGNVVWTVTSVPNFNFYAGTKFGSWIFGKSAFGDGLTSVQLASIRGKCRRVKLKFIHKDASACELYGFGIEFKLKKPY